jgi:hypothetical protein
MSRQLSCPDHRFPILDVPNLSAQETSLFPRETFDVFSARNFLQFLRARLLHFSARKIFWFPSEQKTHTFTVGRVR